MNTLAFSLLASIIGICFAAALTYMTERSILRLNFKKTIYDECSKAVHAWSQSVTSVAGCLASFSATRTHMELVAASVTKNTSDGEINEITQRLEQARADYIDTLRVEVASAVESLAEAHRKVVSYDFALSQTELAFRDTEKIYQDALIEQNKLLNEISALDVRTLSKAGNEFTAAEEKAHKSSAEAAELSERIDALQLDLRQDLIGKLFKLRSVRR